MSWELRRQAGLPVSEYLSPPPSLVESLRHPPTG